MVRRLAKEGRGPRPAVTPEAPANSRGPTPCLVDARLREAPLSLAELRRMVPLRLRTPNVTAPWRALSRVLAMAGICLGLLGVMDLDGGAALLWQAPALALVWIIYGWVLVGLFSLGHDCGHGCFSNRKWINTLIGHLCMSPLGNSLVAWQIAHDHHHRHTQLQGQEVDWSANLRTRAQMRSPSAGNPLLLRSGYRLPCGMVVWIVSNTLRRAFNLRSMMTSVEWRAWKKPLRRSKLSMYLSVVLIYGGLWLWVGFWDMLKYHGVPAAIAMLTGSFIITIQHANFRSLVYTADGWDPARSQMASTFDVRFPKWVEYLWCNINIHIPHHVAPEIPWYHLPESACILSAALPGRYMESRFGVEHLKFFWRTPFLEPVEDKGYFILDSASGV